MISGEQRMSLEASRWAWTVQNLAPTHKLVLLHLADRANQHQNAWPTVKGIQQDTGLGRATVKRALAELRERELIFPMGYGGKTHQAVVYRPAGLWMDKKHGGGFRRWIPAPMPSEDASAEWSQHDGKWSHCDTPPGSQRDGGGITMRPGGSHSEPRNLPVNLPVNRSTTDHQPVPAPLGDAGTQQSVAETLSNLIKEL